MSTTEEKPSLGEEMAVPSSREEESRDLLETLQDKVQDVVEGIEEVIDEVVEEIEEVIDEIVEEVEEVIDEVVEEVEEVIDEVVEEVEEVIEEEEEEEQKSQEGFDETQRLMDQDLDQNEVDEVEEELDVDSLDSHQQQVPEGPARPASPLQEIPYIGDLVSNATSAYHFAKTYHPKIEQSVCFVEDRSKTYYQKFAATEMAQEKIIPVMTRVLSGCLIFLTNAVNNCEELKEQKLRRATDGSIAIVKCFLMALFLEAKRELNQVDYQAAKLDLTKKANVTKVELEKKVLEKREELAKKMAEHEKIKQLTENYAKISDNVKDKYEFVKKNCTYEKMYEAKDGAVNYVRQQMAAT